MDLQKLGDDFAEAVQKARTKKQQEFQEREQLLNSSLSYYHDLWTAVRVVDIRAKTIFPGSKVEILFSRPLFTDTQREVGGKIIAQRPDGEIGEFPFTIVSNEFLADWPRLNRRSFMPEDQKYLGSYLAAALGEFFGS